MMALHISYTINHVAAQFDNRCMSLLSCSNCSSVLFLLKFSDITASSTYKCMSESRSWTMSFIYMRNRSGLSIDPGGTPAVIFCHFEEEPCIFLHLKFTQNINCNL